MRVASKLQNRKDIPARVIVSEYVDVANAFVDRDETGMVNAVLDMLARNARVDEFGQHRDNAVVGHAIRRRQADRPILQAAGDGAGALALTDDAAFFAPPEGQELVLTTDAIVAGVHFLPDDPPETVARKALRVNLSDLAAKGANPAGCLLTLALPEGFGEAWLSPFASGLQSDCDLFGCPFYGGDTVRTTGPLWLSVTAFGTLPRGTMVRRAGAKPGDRIVVTGTIGDAALGLRLLREPDLIGQWSLSDDEAAHLVGRYRVPQPRNAMADIVRAFASAAMDVSDGLAGDLQKLCEVSGVSARIAAARLPLSSRRAGRSQLRPA